MREVAVIEVGSSLKTRKSFVESKMFSIAEDGRFDTVLVQREKIISVQSETGNSFLV